MELPRLELSMKAVLPIKLLLLLESLLKLACRRAVTFCLCRATDAVERDLAAKYSSVYSI